MNQKIKDMVSAALCVALGLIVPQVFHLIPFVGTVPNLGGVFLPMHIPVLLCGLLCGWRYGAACGAVVPLPFLPDGFRQFAALTPFGSMQNVPLRLFSGDIPLSDAPAVMGLQVFWITVLISGGYLLTRNGLRRAVILGG